MIIQHRPRKFGKSKYGFRRFLRGFLDLITVKLVTTYQWRPNHFLGFWALIFVLLAFPLGVLEWLYQIPIGVFVILGLGLQCALIGFLAELWAFQRQNKPFVILEEIPSRTSPSF